MILVAVATTGLTTPGRAACILTHTGVEFGVEFFVARDLMGVENIPEFWYPADALLAAYHEVGRDDLSIDDLKVGKDRQFIQYYAEIAAAFSNPLAFWQITDQPDVVLLETYPSGGLNDGAKHTAEAWQQTWDWLSTYAPATSISLSPTSANPLLLIRCK